MDVILGRLDCYRAIHQLLHELPFADIHQLTDQEDRVLWLPLTDSSTDVHQQNDNHQPHRSIRRSVILESDDNINPSKESIPPAVSQQCDDTDSLNEFFNFAAASSSDIGSQTVDDDEDIDAEGEIDQDAFDQTTLSADGGEHTQGAERTAPHNDPAVEGGKGAESDKAVTGDARVEGNKGAEGDTSLNGDAGIEGDEGDKILNGDIGVEGNEAVAGGARVEGDKRADRDKSLNSGAGIEGDKSAEGDKSDKGLHGGAGVEGDKILEGDKISNSDASVEGNTDAEGNEALAGGARIEGDKGAEGDKSDKCLNGNVGVEGDKSAEGDKLVNGDAGIEGDKSAEGDKTVEGAADVGYKDEEFLEHEELPERDMDLLPAEEELLRSMDALTIAQIMDAHLPTPSQTLKNQDAYFTYLQPNQEITGAIAENLPCAQWLEKAERALYETDSVCNAVRLSAHGVFPQRFYPIRAITFVRRYHNALDAQKNWLEACQWLKTSPGIPPEVRKRTLKVIQEMKWKGSIRALGGSLTVTKLADFLSSTKMLTTTHIDAMLSYLEFGTDKETTLIGYPDLASNLMESLQHSKSLIKTTQALEGSPFEPLAGPTSMRKAQQALSNHRIIYGVAALSTKHFCAYTIEKSADVLTVKWGDSLQLRPPIPRRFVDGLKYFASQYFTPGLQVRITDTLTHAVQLDSCSCGIVAINTVKHALDNTPLWTFPERDAIRARECLNIMEYHLQYPVSIAFRLFGSFSNYPNRKYYSIRGSYGINQGVLRTLSGRSIQWKWKGAEHGLNLVFKKWMSLTRHLAAISAMHKTKIRRHRSLNGGAKSKVAIITFAARQHTRSMDARLHLLLSARAWCQPNGHAHQSSRIARRARRRLRTRKKKEKRNTSSFRMRTRTKGRCNISSLSMDDPLGRQLNNRPCQAIHKTRSLLSPQFRTKPIKRETGAPRISPKNHELVRRHMSKQKKKKYGNRNGSGPDLIHHFSARYTLQSR